MTMAAIDPVMQSYTQEPSISIYDLQQLALKETGEQVPAAGASCEWRKSDHSADHNTKEFENDHVQSAKLDESSKSSYPPPSTLKSPRGSPNINYEQRSAINTSSPVSLLRQQLQEWEAHHGLSAHENRTSCDSQHDHINVSAQTPLEQSKAVPNANLLSKSLETAILSGHNNGDKKYTPLRHMASQPDLAARAVTQVTPYTAHADKSIGVPKNESPHVPIPHDAVNTCSAARQHNEIHLSTEPSPPQQIDLVSSASTVTPATLNTPPITTTGNIAIAANAQPHNLSRTQHKLLLQRQYVFAADRNYLAHPKNMLRLTKEMDRVNREYRQVRKFEDPMTESLRRVAQRLADNKHEISSERLSRCSSASSLSSTSSSPTPETKGIEYLKKFYEIPLKSCQERFNQEYNKKDHVKSFINIK